MAATLLGLATTLANAQSGSAADSAARDLSEQRRAEERARSQGEQLQRAPDVRGQPVPGVQPWPAQESPCFVIRSVQLVGDEAARFQWVLSTLTAGKDLAVGRCLGVHGIGVAAERAQRALLERGYVTSRVLLAAQDLSGGRLVLTFVPGRIRAIRLADPVDARATVRNALPTSAGDILDLREIEQGLENFKRVPTAEADIRIEPADMHNESDLAISWRQAFPFRFSASIDDSGTRATGRYQGSATLSYDHWWTLNDLFYLTLNRDLGGGDSGDRGTRGHTAHYSVPWDHWLLAATHSASRYHQQVAGLTTDYIYSGTRTDAELKLSRLIHRDASRKTSASVKAGMRRSDNAIDDTEVRPQRRATGGWELDLAHREFIGRATLDMALAYRRGTGAFGAIAAPEELFGEGTARMQLASADVSLNAPFSLRGQSLRYAARWRAQWNGTPVAPPERFAIGGRYTVRGFDGESSLSAERGWFVTQDLGWTLVGWGAEAYAGLDYGQVRGPSSALLVGRHLAGAALGLRGSVKQLSYDFFVAKPISRPAYFRTAAVTAGFSLTASF